MHEYPYFVIRQFAALYKRQICSNLRKSREALIEDILLLSHIENKKACVVFAPDDAVYVTPDGKSETSEYPPVSGGI